MRTRLVGLGAAAVVMLAACSGSSGSSERSTSGSSTGGSSDAASYCTLSRSYLAQYDRLETAQDIRQVYEGAARDIHAALAVAPPEIRVDVKVLSDGFDRLIAVLDKYGYDSNRLATAPDDLSDIDTPQFQAAADRVEAYTEQACGR